MMKVCLLRVIIGLLGLRSSLSISVNFEEYNAGDTVRDLGFGISVTALKKLKGGKQASLIPADVMVFDSNKPTGDDSDLGSPNSDFGGPGLGAGGSNSSQYANKDNLGNILILSEDEDSTNPDDNKFGGVITFSFDTPVVVDAIGILDTEKRSYIDITSNDGSTYNFVINPTGDNGFVLAIIQVTNVVLLNMTFVDSFAITSLELSSPALSDFPSMTPSLIPSDLPSWVPSFLESDHPSTLPSDSPSTTVSTVPSDIPSVVPSDMPSSLGSTLPSDTPSSLPSDFPSIRKSVIPSDTPSSLPSDMPSFSGSSLMPSSVRSDIPSYALPISLSNTSSTVPTAIPSKIESKLPSDMPSTLPSDIPSSIQPSLLSDLPSSLPSDVPSSVGTLSLSDVPSTMPSSTPILTSSDSPSIAPVRSPLESDWPSSRPSDAPSTIPISRMSDVPSKIPSESPSTSVTIMPSLASDMPSAIPSDAPEQMISDTPSSLPSDIPSSGPSFNRLALTTDFPSAKTPQHRLSHVPSQSPTIFINMHTPSHAPSKAMCNLDFEEFIAGDEISNLGQGVRVIAEKRRSLQGGLDSAKAMSFNTSSPSGNNIQLGTPHTNFGGPGIGKGGNRFSSFANKEQKKMVLIVSEDDSSSVPEASRFGGVLTFTFSTPRRIGTIGILNLERKVQIEILKGNGNILSIDSAQGGKNSFDAIEIGEEDVIMMVVSMTKAAAITDMTYSCV